jgi:hypothetical protein
MTVKNLQQRTFLIPGGNLERLAAELEKINKRARKIGCAEVSYRTLRIETKPDPVELRHLTEYYGGAIPADALKRLPLVELHEVEIVGEGPVVAGYKFIGKLDHVTLPGSVLMMTVPGESVPVRFADLPPNCDHCSTQRYRKATFVFQSEDGSYKVVGRSCLKDFFGHDPERVTAMLESIWALQDALGGNEWGEPMGGAWMRLYRPDELLCATVAMIRTFGWVSVGRAQGENLSATSWDVSYLFSPPRRSEATLYKKWVDFAAKIKFDPDRDQEIATAAREWLAGVEAKNEYLHNLHQLAAAEAIPAKVLGIWCSLIAAYQRAQDELVKAEGRKEIDEHWGAIKTRDAAMIECMAAIPLEPSEWGERTMYKLLTVEGHALVWFASGAGHMMKGDKLLIKATPKEHGEYQKKKQTIVTRVAVQEVL